MVSSNRGTVGSNCNNCVRIISIKLFRLSQSHGAGKKTLEIAYQVFPNCNQMGSCQPVLVLGTWGKTYANYILHPKKLVATIKSRGSIAY